MLIQFVRVWITRKYSLADFRENTVVKNLSLWKKVPPKKTRKIWGQREIG